MTTLIAYNQSTEVSTMLDVDADQVIELNFGIAEIRDFTQRKSNYSKSFSLPFTPINDAFFGYNFNVNITVGDFNIYQRTKAVLLVDGIPQIEGYLYIVSINLTSLSYEVAMVGELGNLKDELNEKKLKDLDSDWLETFTHVLNYDNVVDSWSDLITYVTPGADQSVIKYPIISHGIGNKYMAMGTNQSDDILTNSGAIQLGDLKPIMKIKTLFDRILLEAGYSYSSNFITNDDFNFSDLYLTLSTNSERVKYRPLPLGFSVENASEQDIIVNKASASAIVAFDTADYDDGNDFDIGTHEWTCAVEGNYQFNLTLIVYFLNSASGLPSQDVNVYVQRDPLGVGSYADFYIRSVTGANQLVVPTGGDSTYNMVFNIYCYVNDKIRVKTNADSITSGDVLKVKELSSFQMLLQPNAPSLSNIYLSDNLPDITQIDFIKSILQHFNMFVEALPQNPKQLLIEPYPDYMDLGTSIDWTDKLVEDKEVQIIPLTDVRKKSLKFEHSPDDVWLAKYRRESVNIPIGSIELIDESNLVYGEEVNQSIFGDVPTKLIATASGTAVRPMYLTYLFGKNNDGTIQPLKNLKPRLVYFKQINYSNSTTDYYKIYDPSITTYISLGYYGYAGNLSSVPATATDYNIDWTLRSFYDSGVLINLPPINVFDTYYTRYFNELYSDDARMFSAYFYLTPLDILTLRFNNKIFIKDCYYRINQITGYNANGNSPCKVELIKIFESNNGLINCDLTPTSSSRNGIVNFVDGSGAAANPTKECCEQLGFVFVDGETPKCYWRLINDDGDVENIGNAIVGG